MKDDSTSAGRRRTVLVVEDSLDFVQVLKTCLEMNGYNVLTAAEGREALHALATRPCDALITDHYMPVMTGTELIKAARLEPVHASLPMILMSSELHRNFTAGLPADVFLLKPFEPSRLLRSLRRLGCLPDPNAPPPAEPRPAEPNLFVEKATY